MMNTIKPESDQSEQDNSAPAPNTPPTKQRVSAKIPDIFKRAKVRGVLPVDDSNGELRTGISFQLENGETVWLNLSCSDAEWMCVTLRSWMSDYEVGKSESAD